jgi:hypothetical protein
MSLTQFAPEQWAQEYTGQWYQALLEAPWPEALAQQTANTLFQLTLLCGQLLMQEAELTGTAEDPDTPPPALPITEALAAQVMEYFAEMLAKALMHMLAMGVPDAPREHVTNVLAEEAYTYCKSMVISVALAPTPPERNDLSQWLTQAAEEAIPHYLLAYENDHGPVILSPLRPENTEEGVTDWAEAANAPAMPQQPQNNDANNEDHANAEFGGDDHDMATPAAPQPGGISSKLAAVAMLLKSLPHSAHANILRLFPPAIRAEVLPLVETDDWLNTIDPAEVTTQLQTLRHVFTQPAQAPPNPLQQLVDQAPWAGILQTLQPERPIWLATLSALKQGEPLADASELPPFMQKALYQHLAPLMPPDTEALNTPQPMIQ